MHVSREWSDSSVYRNDDRLWNRTLDYRCQLLWRCRPCSFRCNSAPNSSPSPNRNHPHMPTGIRQYRISDNMHRNSNRLLRTRNRSHSRGKCRLHQRCWNSRLIHRLVVHACRRHNNWDSLMLCHVYSDRSNGEDRHHYSQLRS